MYTHVSMLPFIVRLVPQSTAAETPLERFERRVHKHLPEWAGGDPPPLGEQFKAPDHGGNYGRDVDPQSGTPFMVARQALMTVDGTPCGPPPFGSIVAINLNTGLKLWTIPNGAMTKGELGGFGMSGPIVTASGILFVASIGDESLRAYNSATGVELWRGQLPGPPDATPMTYKAGGRQYLVVAEGGNRTDLRKEGQAIVAFALPETATTERNEMHRH